MVDITDTHVDIQEHMTQQSVYTTLKNQSIAQEIWYATDSFGK